MALELHNVSLPETEAGTGWNVSIDTGQITSIRPHNTSTSSPNAQDRGGALLAPSFCHPHIHIDKPYLLSHPKYAHLRLQKGGFEEAMSLTGQAKAEFEEWDLLERGQRLIDESVAAGVTHMRAFVEVDSIVKSKCLNVGLQLKRKAEKEGRCRIQLCAFAQLPINSSERDEDDHEIRSLLESAAANDEIEALGATPYVESNEEKSKWNVDYMIQLCIQSNKHLDFHLDFSMDASTKPMVHYVCERLKHHKWTQRTDKKTISLGHCTLLSLQPSSYFANLATKDLSDLPISFVGIPTSDLFMGWSTSPNSRGTLQVPQLIKDHNIQACLSVNNIGNAFTPHGTCDPLTLACNGVGIYQAGTEADAEVLYECVSTRAKKAIGFSEDGGTGLEVREGDRADFVVFGTEREEWRTRKSVVEAVYLYDGTRGREAWFGGVRTNVEE